MRSACHRSVGYVNMPTLPMACTKRESKKVDAKTVVLDGHTLNPGDLSWNGFKSIGDIAVYDRTPDDQTTERAAGCPYVLTNKVVFSAQTLAALPDLRYIGVLATGYNTIDTEAAAERGVVVTNIPTYGTDSVAQHATALMLEMIRHVAVHSNAVHAGEWTSCIDWCFALKPITELTGKVLGIVGLGRIGLAFAKICAAMGMRIIAHDEYHMSAEQLGSVAVQYVDVDTLFQEADVISLHCPLTSKTDRLVNATRLGLMKPTAVLINTSRGPLINNQELADALRAGTIAGAAVDVLDIEPPPADNPLIGAPNCIVTPHISWYAKESRQRLMDIAVDNLKAFIAGKPVNQVN